MIKTTAIAISITLMTVMTYAATPAKSSNVTLIPAKDIKWAPMPGFTGVSTATVNGDATTGPHHAFMKFTPGFSAPLHHHTADHNIAVVSGTLVLTVDGKEHRLPAGSYFSFKNKTQHQTKCAEGAECVLFADVRGAWDVVPEAPAKK